MIKDHTTEFLTMRQKVQLKMHSFNNYSPLLDIIKADSKRKSIKKILSYIPLNLDELLLKNNYIHFLNRDEHKKLNSTIERIEKEIFSEVLKELKIQMNKQTETQRKSILEKISALINDQQKPNL